MYMVYMFEGWLPDLRYMSLRYTDWAYDDVFEQVTWGSVPRQVTHLSIDYSFSAPASEVRAFEAATILRLSGRIFRSRFPDIKRLSFSGMSTRLVATMLKLFPNVETLEIAHPVQLAALAPLPPTVRTLVLCYPGVAVSKDTLASRALDTALEAGLFAEGTKSRIIVRSGAPDHVAFVGPLRRTCEGFNAVLVYERDDFQRRGC